MKEEFAKVASNKVNVSLLILIIFNSGGVRIIDNFLITLLFFFIFTLKFLIEEKFDFIYFFKATLIIGGILFGHYLLTSVGAGVSIYIVYFSYFIMAIALVTTYIEKRNLFLIDLNQAIKFFMWHAVVGIFIGRLMGNIDFGDTFAGVFVFAPLVLDGGRVIARNAGLFWEPGILQIFMNILLYLSLFVFKSRKYAILSVIVILSTFSTAGYVILALQLVYMYIKSPGNRSQLVTIIAMMMIPIVIVFAAMTLINKFSGDQAKSAGIRFFDMEIASHIIMDNPVLGVGLNDDRFKLLQEKFGDPIREDYLITSRELETIGTTNGILRLFTSLGIPIALLFIYLIARQKQIQGRLFLCMMMLFSMSEPIVQTSFYALFMMFGLRELISPPSMVERNVR